MIPKFSLDNLDSYKIIDYLPILEANELDYVYRPNDDSYLLLDALKMDIEEMVKSPDSKWVLEIGCGSGIIINNYAFWINNAAKEIQHLFMATDINFDACLLTKKFSDYYKNHIEVFNDDIVNSLLGRIQGKIDVLICNPPYVPTSEEELIAARKKLSEKNKNLINELQSKTKINCIDASYAGGIDGNQITDQILEYSKKLLKPGGIFYLLLIEENQPSKIVQKMQKCFSAELLLKKTFSNEKQYIFKFVKK